MPEPPTATTDIPLANHLARAVLHAEHTSDRYLLRRGHSPTTEHYAYPALAQLWEGRDWAKDPVLRYAAMVTTHLRIKQTPGMTIGKHFAQLSRNRNGMSHESIERRLIAMQSAPLDLFHQHLRSLLSGPLSEQIGLDWWQVAHVYLGWDNPNRETRTSTRRQLLEHYSQQRHRTPAIVETTPEN